MDSTAASVIIAGGSALVFLRQVPSGNLCLRRSFTGAIPEYSFLEKTVLQ
jgi:hypothetical protein